MKEQEIKPLVSDEQIAYMRMGALEAYEYGDKRTRQELIMDSAEGGCRFAMHLYEVDRAASRLLIERLRGLIVKVQSNYNTALDHEHFGRKFTANCIDELIAGVAEANAFLKP